MRKLNHEDYLINYISDNNNLMVGITDKKINIPELISFSKSPESGALSLFIGTTRNNFENKHVLKLYYEYHPTMTLKVLKQLAEESIIEYMLNKCVIVHRVDEVPVTEESIVIITSSSHRNAAINCSSYIIDEVKKRVPIWKKEIYDDDSAEWKG